MLDGAVSSEGVLRSVQGVFHWGQMVMGRGHSGYSARWSFGLLHELPPVLRRPHLIRRGDRPLASYRTWSGHHCILPAFKLHLGVQQRLHVLGGLLHELPLVPVVGEEIKLMI